MGHRPWIIFVVIALFGAAGMSRASDKPELKDEKDKINYSVGYQIGGDFSSQGLPLNADALVQGVRDALEGSNTMIPREEMLKILQELKKKVVAQDMKQKKVLTDTFRGEGRDFLAANTKKEGVVTLPSGLQYKVLRQGEGKSPTANDSVTVHYCGTLIDGTEFDSSHRGGKPATFTLSGTIPGWKEALPLMKVGAEWQLFIPSDLAFGERGPLADRTVIYEISLLSIDSAQ